MITPLISDFITDWRAAALPSQVINAIENGGDVQEYGILNRILENINDDVALRDVLKTMKKHGWKTYPTFIQQLMEGGHVRSVEYLAGIGYDINARDNQNQNGLFWLVHLNALPFEKFMQALSSFIAMGAEYDIVNTHGQNLVHLAIRNNIEVLEAVCSLGLDISLQNNRGWTPLHEAAHNSKKDIIYYLVSLGADKTKRVFDNLTKSFKGEWHKDPQAGFRPIDMYESQYPRDWERHDPKIYEALKP